MSLLISYNIVKKISIFCIISEKFKCIDYNGKPCIWILTLFFCIVLLPENFHATQDLVKSWRVKFILNENLLKGILYHFLPISQLKNPFEKQNINSAYKFMWSMCIIICVTLYCICKFLYRYLFYYIKNY